MKPIDIPHTIDPTKAEVLTLYLLGYIAPKHRASYRKGTVTPPHRVWKLSDNTWRSCLEVEYHVSGAHHGLPSYSAINYYYDTSVFNTLDKALAHTYIEGK